MECPVCMERLDQDARMPKSLPCGHSICLACLLQLKEHICPTCRKELPDGQVSDLPGNYMVMQMMTNSAVRDKQPGCRCRRWCSTCRVVATASCEDDGHHTLRPSTALRLQVAQVQEQLPQLQQEVHEQLQALAAADTAEDKALAGLQCLGGRGLTCKLEVCRDGEPSYGAKWSVSESALKDKLLRALALVLVQDGELTQQEVVQGSAPELQGQQRAQEVVQGPEAGIDELDVKNALRTEDKAVLLRRVRDQGVRRMTQVYGNSDPSWELQLLQCAAPMLEKLQVLHVGAEHLLVVHGMPRLRSLHVYRPTGDQDSFPAALPPLPADHAGLQWLCVQDVPRQTTIALLEAHGHSLQELWMWVGTGWHLWGWPRSCEDLRSLLQQCGPSVRALRRFVLDRLGCRNLDPECLAQLEAARRLLPGVTVLCRGCDEVPYEF